MNTVATHLSHIKASLNPRRRRYRQLAKQAQPLTFTLRSGLTYQIYPVGQIPELLYTMNFEFEQLSLVDSLLGAGMNVVDVGANCGLYSVIAGKKIGPTGRVWAFEPARDSAERLKANMDLNGLTSYVLEREAVSGKAGGYLELVNEPGLGDGYRYLTSLKNLKKKIGTHEDQFAEIERVPVTALDSYRKKAGSFAVDFLKIDVEGGEYDVVAGAQATLTENKNIVVLFESTPIGLIRAGHTQKELHRLMQDLGFSLYAWDEKRRAWSDNGHFLVTAGNVWAVRDKGLLPRHAA